MSIELQSERRTSSPQHPNAAKAWTLFTLSAVGMMVFMVLYFFAPKTRIQVQTVTRTVTNNVINTVTNEVVKEVPKEVEKIVNVPAKIPDEYLTAMGYYIMQTNAPIVHSDKVLFNMKSVRTVIYLDTTVKELVSADEVKAKFELTLRRNNVPVNPDSPHSVSFAIEGFVNASKLLCYSIHCHVDEMEWVWRKGQCAMSTVTVWEKGSYGTVGTLKAQDTLLKEAELEAELFANDFLTANPKPQ